MTFLRRHFFQFGVLLTGCLGPLLISALRTPADTLHFINPRKDTQDLVAEGASIGQVRIGENLDDVIHDLGPPSTSDDAMGKSLCTWKGHGASFLQVYAARDFGHDGDRALVREIRTNSPVFRTVAGLGVGTPLSAFTIRYGYMTAVGTYDFNGGRATVFDVPKRGVAFDLFPVHGNAHCIAVTVCIPGENPAATYLPILPDFRPST